MQLFKLTVLKKLETQIQQASNFFTFGQFDKVLIEKLDHINSFKQLDISSDIDCNKQIFYIFRDDNNFKLDNDNKFQFITFYFYNKYYFFNMPKATDMIDQKNGIATYFFNTVDNFAFVSITYTNDYYQGIQQIRKVIDKYHELSNNSYSISIANMEKITEHDIFDIQLSLNIRDNREFFVPFMDDEFKNIKYTINNVTGNKDVLLQFPSIPLKRYYEFYKKHIRNKDQIKDASTYLLAKNCIVQCEQSSSEKTGTSNDLNILLKDYPNLNMISFSNNLKEKNSKLEQFIQLFQSEPYYKGLSLSIYPSLSKCLKEYQDDKVVMHRYSEEIYTLSKILTEKVLHTYHDPIYQSLEYMIPEKLLTYYTYFLYYIRDHYSEIEEVNKDDKANEIKDKFDFSFIVKPCIGDVTNIQRLQENNKPTDRVLLISIPIDHIFDVDLTTFELVHEIFHYINSKIRNREKRLVGIKKCISGYLFDSIVGDSCTQTSLYRFFEELVNDVFDSVKISQNYQDINIEDYNYYLSNLQPQSEELIDLLARNYLNISKYLSKKIDETNDYEYLITNILYINNEENYDNFWRELKYLYRECFADLMAIKLLEISYSKYLSFFYRSNNISADCSINELIKIRIAFVSFAAYGIEGTKYNWKDLNWIDGGVLADLAEYIRQISIDQYQFKNLVFKDVYSLKEFKDYLNVCSKDASDFFKGKKEQCQIVEMGEYFKQLSNKDDENYISHCMLAMEKFVKEYYKGKYM